MPELGLLLGVVLLLAGCEAPAIAVGQPGRVASTSAQPVAAPRSETRLPSGLALWLSTDQGRYILGQPVEVSVQVTNPSGQRVPIYRGLDVRYGRVEVEISISDGPFRRYVGPGFGTKDTLLPESALEPGETISTTFRVLYHHVTRSPDELPDYYAFARAGTYRLRVRLRNILPEALATTEAITIEFGAPQGEDAACWKLLQTRDAAYFLHTGRPLADQAVIGEMEQILARYPDTTYAPQIRAALAGMKAEGSRYAAETALRDLDSRTVIVSARPGVSNAAADAVSRAVLDRISTWAAAYNAGDSARFAESFSLQTDLRRKWDQGPGDRDRQEIETRFAQTLAAAGALSVDVTRITVGDAEATADVVARFQHPAETRPLPRMVLVLDTDGVWRILDAGF